jgi:medium-chain acyl-[acyl-carrier-protein] hydrolase
MPEQGFVEELRRFEGTPEEVLQNVELLQLLIPALRADFEVVGTYSYADEAPLDCPISVFGGREDSEVSEEELESWREQTTRDVKLRMLPGGHFFVQTAQAAILQAINSDLAPLLRAW